MKYSPAEANQELERKDHKNLFFSNIIQVYRNCLELVIILSSFFFIFWFLAIFISWEILQYALVAILFFISFTTRGRRGQVIKNETILRFSKYFLRTIKIIGSIFVIFLFTNSYLDIISFLNQGFLNIISGLEGLLNTTTIAILFSLLFIFSYVYLFLIFFNFIKRKAYPSIFMTAGILVLLAPLIFIIKEISSLSLSFSETIYSRLSWLVGFSLIFIHLNYLIREIIIFLKGRETEIIN